MENPATPAPLATSINGRTLTITPGTLDKDAETAFTYGACSGLAVALHDATGWPLVAITARGETEHYLVRMPDGRYLDVMGVQDDEDIRFAWEVIHPITLTEVSPDEVWETYRDYHGEPIPMGVVRSIAHAVLVRAGIVGGGSSAREALLAALVWPAGEGRCGMTVREAAGLVDALQVEAV